MFDNMDFSKMGDMIKDMQENAGKMQEDLKNKRYSAKSGGGIVEVIVNGTEEVIDINIDDSLLKDKDSLQILLISCVNDAFKMASEDKKASAMNMFGDMSKFQK